jgi:hypothetical protein
LEKHSGSHEYQDGRHIYSLQQFVCIRHLDLCFERGLVLCRIDQKHRLVREIQSGELDEQIQALVCTLSPPSDRALAEICTLYDQVYVKPSKTRVKKEEEDLKRKETEAVVNEMLEDPAKKEKEEQARSD